MQPNPLSLLKKRHQIALHQYVTDTAAARPTIIAGETSPLLELVRNATGLQTIKNVDLIAQGQFRAFVLSLRKQFQQFRNPPTALPQAEPTPLGTPTIITSKSQPDRPIQRGATPSL